MSQDNKQNVQVDNLYLDHNPKLTIVLGPKLHFSYY